MFFIQTNTVQGHSQLRLHAQHTKFCISNKFCLTAKTDKGQEHGKYTRVIQQTKNFIFFLANKGVQVLSST
jgi:hypothetical protein